MADAGSKSCEHFDHGHKRLERFQAKWKPVRVKKTRQIRNLEPRFDSIEAEKALGGWSRGVIRHKLICLAVDRELRRPGCFNSRLHWTKKQQFDRCVPRGQPDEGENLGDWRKPAIQPDKDPTIIGGCESDATMQPTLSDNRHARHCAAMLVRPPRSQMSVRSSEASISKRDPMTFSEASWRSLL